MGASHPVTDNWEPYQGRLSDSAPEVPPTFLKPTTARLFHRHQAFEFLEPVEDDNYFRRHQILLTLDHQETLPIGRDVVIAS